MALAPEAPEIGGLGALAINFLLLCFAILMFGMIRGSTLIVQAIHFVIQHTIGAIPLVGDIVNAITGPVFAAVERGFADAAIGVEGAIGYYWHALATIAGWLAREIRSQAALIERLAYYALPSTWADIAWHELGKLRQLIDSYARGIDRLAGRIDRFIDSLPGRVQNIIEPRIRSLDHTLDRVVLPDIAGLRARTRSLLDRLDNLWERVRKLDKLLGTAAFAEAVAVALAALGASWITCRNWKRIGRNVCGMPTQLLDDLLGLIVDLIILENICSLIPLLETAASDVGTPLVEALTVVGAGLCSGNQAPALLTGPASQPVPLQFDGTLVLAA